MAQPDSCWRIFIMWSHIYSRIAKVFFFHFTILFSLSGLTILLTYLFIIVALPLIGLIDFVLLTMFLSDLLDKQDLWYWSHVFGIFGIEYTFRFWIRNRICSILHSIIYFQKNVFDHIVVKRSENQIISVIFSATIIARLLGFCM